MKRNLNYIFLYILISCQSNPTIKSLNQADTLNPIKEVKKQKNFSLDYCLTDSIYKRNFVHEKNKKFLRDTITLSGEVIFNQININYYNNLIQFSLKKEIPIYDFSKIISVIDSCKLIKLQNKETDTLCDFSDGEYFETFTIKSDWKIKNQILIHFDNWEESHDFLLSKKDGSTFILTPDYRLSPNENRIITFSNIIDNGLYSNHFGLSWIDSDTARLDINWEFESYGIFDVDWIENNKALIKLGIIEFQNYSVKEYKYYIMIIK